MLNQLSFIIYTLVQLLQTISGPFPLSARVPREVLYFLGRQLHETLAAQCATEAKLTERHCGVAKTPTRSRHRLPVFSVTG